MNPRILVIAFMLALPGCHSLAQYTTSEKVFDAVQVDYDEYRGTILVTSPVVWYNASLGKAHLQTLISRDGYQTNHLYVVPDESRRGRNFVFYPTGRAVDWIGTQLRTQVIDRRVNAHWTSIPHVAVELPDGYLEDASATGIDIQLQGKRNRTVIRLPAHYVRGFVDKLHIVVQNAPATLNRS